MIKIFRLLLGLLLALPAMTHALGLGDIHLGSALNQPLRADIELVGATAEELTQLRASLAPREAFTRNGLDRPQFLTALTFGVGKDANGHGVLQVRSTSAVTEPFVTFLVEVTWPRGHLIREYTVLLDPPVFEARETPAPAVAAPRTGETTGAAAGSVERSPAAAPAPTPAAATGSATGAAAVLTTRAGGRASSKDSRRRARRSGAAAPADLNRS
jgi:pilus assembly protein FimV